LNKTASQKRNEIFGNLSKEIWDVLIIGGGATGAGTALDCAKRGLKVLLIDKNDFSSGTSSRSTKLIHGGVRYLAQLHFGLIKEALTERAKLLENAPHLVKPLKFVLPTYKFYEKSYYSIGMTMYDILAVNSKLPPHARISEYEILTEFGGLSQKDLKGGISYYDAQFNDSRLNINLVRCAEKEGATVLNRIELENFMKTSGKITGAILKDKLSGNTVQIQCKIAANTTGVHIDAVRKIDDPECNPVLTPSQGIHLVFSKEKISCKSAMIIPKTSDDRVVFLIPWEDHVIMGTTDTPIEKIDDEPMPIDNEIDYLLETGNEYLQNKLSKGDILSVFVGLRPLISTTGEGNTKNISREEMILISNSGLVTMSGGKWSTYRKMAEDLTDRIIREGRFAFRKCLTHNYSFIGKEGFSENLFLEIQKRYKLDDLIAKRLQNHYGGEVFSILGEKPVEILKSSGYFVEEIKHAIHSEYALSSMDFLSRRVRILFLDLQRSKNILQSVNSIFASELGWDSKQKKEDEKEVLSLIQSFENSIVRINPA